MKKKFVQKIEVEVSPGTFETFDSEEAANSFIRANAVMTWFISSVLNPKGTEQDLQPYQVEILDSLMGNVDKLVEALKALDPPTPPPQPVSNSMAVTPITRAGPPVDYTPIPNPYPEDELFAGIDGKPRSEIVRDEDPFRR